MASIFLANTDPDLPDIDSRGIILVYLRLSILLIHFLISKIPSLTTKLLILVKISILKLHIHFRFHIFTAVILATRRKPGFSR
jgi:hypothetical protein